MSEKKFLVLLFYIVIINSIYSLSVNAQEENNFKSGEKLRFVIYYGLLDGGYVDAELKDENLSGNKVFHGKMTAKSTGLADALYKVRDEYQSWFDYQYLLPVKSLRDINEGKYKKYDLVHYDHKSQFVYNNKSDTISVPANIRDMISTFYYLRNIDFNNMKDGFVIRLNTFFDNEVFPFDMRYKGKETIKTRKGTFHCIKLVPFVEPGRIFNNEDDMTIWLSDDRNKIPVRVKFDLKVGSIKCDLIEFSGLKF